MKYILNKDYGYDIHMIETDKFKTNTISIKFTSELKRENITKRALLPSILYSGCKKYKTKRELVMYLEELYDASISLSMSKVGNLSIISISINYINEEYIGEEMLPKVIDLFKEVVFNPLIIDEGFDKEKLLEEKRLLSENIDSLNDDKTGYALDKMKEYMYENEKIKIKAIGYKEDLDSITAENLYEEYKYMIENDKVDVIVAGKFNDLTPFEDFSFSNKEIVSCLDLETKDIHKTEEYKEIQDVNQAKLNIGYRTEIRFNDELYYAMVVGNSLLGSAPNSMLFQTVREEHSLCYYIRSVYNPYKGVIHLYSGINADTYENAYKIISEQIEKLKKGDFSDQLLHNVKKSLVNDILEMMDRQATLISKAYQDILIGREFGIETMIETIENITREDIMSAASRIKEDTIFLLTNKEGE
ncbi:pitrilysin family protein [Mycoplasmatota bacterium zrk1]